MINQKNNFNTLLDERFENWEDAAEYHKKQAEYYRGEALKCYNKINECIDNIEQSNEKLLNDVEEFYNTCDETKKEMVKMYSDAVDEIEKITRRKRHYFFYPFF